MNFSMFPVIYFYELQFSNRHEDTSQVLSLHCTILHCLPHTVPSIVREKRKEVVQLKDE